MGRLVYHDLSAISGQLSTFDEAVLEVAISGSVSIVSPYIGVDYLQRIIQVSTEWKLISDIEAWLSSLSIRARPKAWLFIRENLERIHHCPAIHAKAVISKKLAMFGSANLTNTGILERTELGILIDNPLMVIELGAWFDSLWQQTLPPIADETNAFVQWLDEEAERTPSRRDKFSLSASSKKIRSRLVKLQSPDAPKRDGNPLNLDTIAQTLVLQEQRHYDTLEEAVEVAVNTLAKYKFAFRQVVEIVRKGFPSASIREIYFVLLQHCANHVRSVFAENTRNRLILADGIFVQSSKELIHQALAPFDAFLAHLVKLFDFSQAQDIPDEFSFEALTGISGSNQTILISELLDCGFLEIEDIAGHLPQYNLSDTFEWNGRYKLFTKAMHDWEAKKSWSMQLAVQKTSEVNEIAALTPRKAPKFISEDNMSLSAYLRLEKEKMGKAEIERKEKLDLKYRQRQDGIDKILAHLLLRLLSGETLPSTEDILLQLPVVLSVKLKLVEEIVLGKAMDMPKAIVTTDGDISINTNLDWKDLANYPLTQDVCRSFLEM